MLCARVYNNLPFIPMPRSSTRHSMSPPLLSRLLIRHSMRNPWTHSPTACLSLRRFCSMHRPLPCCLTQAVPCCRCTWMTCWCMHPVNCVVVLMTAALHSGDLHRRWQMLQLVFRQVHQQAHRRATMSKHWDLGWWIAWVIRHGGRWGGWGTTQRRRGCRC